MTDDDPIVAGLRDSVQKAASKIRPKTRSTFRGGSGFAAPTIKIGAPKSLFHAMTTCSIPTSSGGASTPQVVSVPARPPESDRARPLSRKERQVKKKKRQARKSSSRKNRRGKKK